VVRRRLCPEATALGLDIGQHHHQGLVVGRVALGHRGHGAIHRAESACRKGFQARLHRMSVTGL